MNKKIFKAIIFFLLALVAFPAGAYVPLDPLYPEQTYLKQIGVDRAWDYAKGDGVVVAVLDSGVDVRHPDLKYNIWRNHEEVANDGIDNDNNGYIDDAEGWDFVNQESDPSPKTSANYSKAGMDHGTAIAGIIGAVANNNRGLTGIAFNAKIMPLRILDSDGNGDVSTLIEAIKYAVNEGANIINLSLVGYEYSRQLEETIQWANSRGLVVVAASGNGNTANPSGVDLDKFKAYPACYGNNSDNNLVVAVASVGDNDVKSAFSNFGANCIDLSAPGENLSSLAFYDPGNDQFNNYYSYGWQGTSFAAAVTSGVAALVKSRNHLLTPSQLVKILTDDADNINSKNSDFFGKLGQGRLNAARALAATPVPVGGRLIKLSDSNAVYYIDQSSYRHLFVNEVTYWTWYSGAWSEQKVETVSQSEFDSFQVGNNVRVRPGTALVKFENSPRIYAVDQLSNLCLVADGDYAGEVYGADWQKRIAVIQNGFENDYVKNKNCFVGPGQKYLDGSIIQYANSTQIWYIDSGQKRPVGDSGFSANNFQDKYLIKRAAADIDYSEGQAITGWEPGIFSYSLAKQD